MTGLDAHLVVDRGDVRVDVALTVAPGRTLAVMGPNGAGKSTIVSALAGLLRLRGGHVRLDGRVLDDVAAGVHVPSPDRRIGVGFQQDTLFPHLTVAQNVAFGAADQPGEWLTRLGIADLASRRPGDLSGGQAQRVSLARALATDPALLLLDEPLAAIDPAGRGELRDLLREVLVGTRVPRVIVTHDLADAFLLADDLVVVEDGRVTNAGTVAEVRDAPATSWAAELVGANLFEGRATPGSVDITGHQLATTASVSGAVLVTIRPNAVALHLAEPTGSPRNAWRTTVASVEVPGDVARVRLGAPLALTVEVTPGTVDDLGLAPGREVWASLKATQVSVRTP